MCLHMTIFKRSHEMCAYDSCHYTYNTGPLTSEEMSICTEWQDKWNTCFLPQRVTMRALCAVIFEHSRDILIRCEQTLAVYRFDLEDKMLYFVAPNKVALQERGACHCPDVDRYHYNPFVHMTADEIQAWKDRHKGPPMSPTRKARLLANLRVIAARRAAVAVDQCIGGYGG
ncbi:hypothetical protein [Pompano iridovirus]|uniref:Uncharacterized protein n=1 Tax=Pompano iridovirus TaxID=2494350 RepID=A0A3S5HRE5_ISKNV|nr:hypothetical protein [Pompano iridovirus]